MNKIILVETIHHNEKWAKFLEELPNSETRTTAGLVMDWIKETYPQFKDTLNGKIIAEITKQT